MKKLIALVLALALVLMAASALAVTIEVNKKDTNDDPTAVTYTYYKIFDVLYAGTSHTTGDADIAANPQSADTGFTYLLPKNSPLKTTVEGLSGVTLTESTDGLNYIVAYTGNSLTSSTAQSWASTLLTAIKALDATNLAKITSGPLTYDDSSKSYKSGNLAMGYYLISSDHGTTLALATSDIDITEKNDYPTIDKQFSDNATEASSVHDDVQVGDTVSYTLIVTIPNDVAEKEIVITDTYEPGIDPVVDSANGGVVATTITGLPTGKTATVSAPDSTNHKFTVTLDAETVKASHGATITIVYTAVINEKAAVAITEENKVKLKYGNDYESDEHKVDSKTYHLTINKTDGTNPLKGAQFELYRDDSTTKIQLIKLTETELSALETKLSFTRSATTVYYRVAVATDAVGSKTTTIDMAEKDASNNLLYSSAVVYGLDGDSTYKLTEITAPSGYNILKADTEVDMEGTDKSVTVVNNQGTELPSTGGIGTTIFYILGGLLVIGAAVILVARRKANN